MAKKSMIEREKKREKLVAKYAEKRAALKEIASDESRRWKSASSASELANCRAQLGTRLHNRCQLTGVPRLLPQTEVSRIALRDLGSNGQIPGMVKSSW